MGFLVIFVFEIKFKKTLFPRARCAVRLLTTVRHVIQSLYMAYVWPFLYKHKIWASSSFYNLSQRSIAVFDRVLSHAGLVDESAAVRINIRPTTFKLSGILCFAVNSKLTQSQTSQADSFMTHSALLT